MCPHVHEYIQEYLKLRTHAESREGDSRELQHRGLRELGPFVIRPEQTLRYCYYISIYQVDAARHTCLSHQVGANTREKSRTRTRGTRSFAPSPRRRVRPTYFTSRPARLQRPELFHLYLTRGLSAPRNKHRNRVHSLQVPSAQVERHFFFYRNLRHDRATPFLIHSFLRPPAPIPRANFSLIFHRRASSLRALFILLFSCLVFCKSRRLMPNEIYDTPGSAIKN